MTPSILEEFEDALNQGSISAVVAFIKLRSKSILHFFAAIGKFLGLEVVIVCFSLLFKFNFGVGSVDFSCLMQVYEHGFGINKVPKNLLDGSSTLTLGFPDCESSHLLLMELEKDFTPLFKLVETQMDDSGKPQSFNDLSNALRVKKIDIGQIRILEDDLNLITSDVVRFISSFSDAEGINQASGHRHPGLIDEALAEMSGSQLSFSSIVDEVFGIQKGTSALVSSDGHGSLPKNLSAVNGPGKAPLLTSYHSDSLYNLPGPLQSSSFNLLSSPPGKGSTMKKTSIFSSDQELSMILSPSLSTGNGVSESGGRLVTESALSPLSVCKKFFP